MAGRGRAGINGRAIAVQALLVAALAGLFIWIAGNVGDNLRQQNIASGFAFLERTAGFDISQKLIAYKNTDTYGRAFLVGLANTLLAGSLALVLATAAGFALGLARLSANWLVAHLALLYVEVVRNIPLLLWLLMIYAVLLRLPAPADSIALPFGTQLNQRGLYFPVPLATPAFHAVVGLALAGVVLALILARPMRLKVWQTAALGVLPGALAAALGWPFAVSVPQMGPFNLEGGIAILPEFIALVAGLVLYTAAYIGEIVRAGLLSVPPGQRDAAAALGLEPRDTLRLITVPLALRAIVPPLTNQYLNLVKNSSLAVAVGYPDVASVLAGTILNHTNQAIEAVAMTMAVYLTLSLLIALVMNTLNARVALKER
jgi:general L-amino acid transport system permease protein